MMNNLWKIYELLIYILKYGSDKGYDYCLGSVILIFFFKEVDLKEVW